MEIAATSIASMLVRGELTENAVLNPVEVGREHESNMNCAFSSKK